MTAARTFSLCRLARTKESLSSTFGDPACNVCLEEPAPGCTMRHRGLYPFLKPPGPMYDRRTGMRSDAIRCTRRTRSATGTRPTIVESAARAIPTAPVAAANRTKTASRDRAAIRGGFDLDQRFATPRPIRAARGAAIAVARTADITRRKSTDGAAHPWGHGARSPASPRTAAAAPLRARWMMNRTATLRSAVDVETAPKTTMN